MRTAKIILTAILLTWPLGSPAAALEREIPDVYVTLQSPDDPQPRRVRIGRIVVQLHNEHDASVLDATFFVDPDFHDAIPGDAFKHFQVHFVQIINFDDWPARVEGRTPQFPILDMPAYGWDYIYRSGSRDPDNVTGRDVRDDATDALPWYHTHEEERMEHGSGNERGGFGHFNRGVNYGIKDRPTLCPKAGRIHFSTFLVVVPTRQPPEGGPFVRTDEFLILTGFDWIMASNYLHVFESDVDVDIAHEAMENANVEGWRARNAGVIYYEPARPTGQQERPVEIRVLNVLKDGTE